MTLRFFSVAQFVDTTTRLALRETFLIFSSITFDCASIDLFPRKVFFFVFLNESWDASHAWDSFFTYVFSYVTWHFHRYIMILFVIKLTTKSTRSELRPSSSCGMIFCTRLTAKLQHFAVFSFCTCMRAFAADDTFADGQKELHIKAPKGIVIARIERQNSNKSTFA